MVLPAFAPAAPYVVPTTMLDAIKHLGLPLPKLCLDAGDSNSVVSGSQTKWLDVSGNGYDFFRGTDATSQSSDPTFNGTPGGQGSSEFYGFDGGDYFTYDSANETWMDNLHKDSAKWAFAGWVYLPSLSTSTLLFQTGFFGDHVGVAFLVLGNSRLRISVVKGNLTTPAAQISGTSTVAASAWGFIAGQIDEAAGTGVLQINATQEDVVSTYSGPSSAAATKTLTLAKAEADESPSTSFPSGSRMASAVMWEALAPTKAELLQLYNATKSKFGL